MSSNAKPAVAKKAEVNVDSMVGGLKYQVARFRNQSQDWEKKYNDGTAIFIQSTRMLYKAIGGGNKGKIECIKLINKYKGDEALWVQLEDTSVVGITTKIGEYENKKGIKSMAHFTENDKYIGSVKQLGDKPIGYKGWVKITQERFTFNWELFESDTPISTLAELYKPKVIEPPVAVEEEDEDEAEDEDEDEDEEDEDDE